jgi:hypothetical protein
MPTRRSRRAALCESRVTRRVAQLNCARQLPGQGPKRPCASGRPSTSAWRCCCASRPPGISPRAAATPMTSTYRCSTAGQGQIQTYPSSKRCGSFRLSSDPNWVKGTPETILLAAAQDNQPRRHFIGSRDARVCLEQIDVHASDQIWALPPSTNSSMPVMKLESSEARNSAALAISPGEPMRPIGMVDTILAIASGG